MPLELTQTDSADCHMMAAEAISRLEQHSCRQDLCQKRSRPQGY